MGVAIAVVDPITLTMGAVIGAAAGILASYFVFYAKPSQPRVQVLKRDQEGQLRPKTITVDELDRSRRETKTLLLERDLLSSALTKIYEAETEGKITREEREMIARRYGDQIREMETKLRDKELIVEVGELERLRDELVSLFREKIQNIESRLDQARERLQPAPKQEVGREEASVPRRQSPAAQVDEDLERVVERKTASKRDVSEGERRVRELRDEVMEALTKLEQIDVRKEEENETA